MGNLNWFMFGVKYYLEIWFLHTTGLLRHQRSQKNVKKATKFFKGHSKDHSSILSKNYIFLPYVDRFDIRIQPNEGIWPPRPKAKKTNIRPNVSKLDFRIFRGLTMVSQHAKGSYKMLWRPIGIRFWETTTPEPKMGQKISSDQIFLKVKKTR